MFYFFLILTILFILLHIVFSKRIRDRKGITNFAGLFTYNLCWLNWSYIRYRPYLFSWLHCKSDWVASRQSLSVWSWYGRPCFRRSRNSLHLVQRIFLAVYNNYKRDFFYSVTEFGHIYQNIVKSDYAEYKLRFGIVFWFDHYGNDVDSLHS